jgi:hypothetical protein
VTAIRLLRRDSFCQKQSLRTETDKLYMRPILRFRYEQISLDKWARLWHGCYEFYQSNYPLDPHTHKFLLQSLITDAILTTAIECAWFRQASVHRRMRFQ